MTIGANTLSDSKSVGAPVIGDNCYIGAGAKIIGKVVIGNNVRIAANATVYSDVPDNSVVVSGEQKVIPKAEGQINRFHAYLDDVWRYFDNGTWVEERDPKVIEVLDFCKKSYDT